MKILNLFHLIFILPFVFNPVMANNPNDDNKIKFEFSKELDNAEEVEYDKNFISQNYLGQKIAEKLYVLQELYTYTEEPTPTDPAVKTIINKPSIYYSLKKLNRHYKKMVKKT